MGIQTNIILGGLLIASLGASALYINLQKSKIEKLQVELNVAIQNQKVLENTVAEQNENMKQQLENQKQNQEKIRELTETSNKANEEVKKLRNTFARHDLNNLAIAKPGLMEGIVNRGTKKVTSELIELTNLGQFDDEVIINYDSCKLRTTLTSSEQTFTLSLSTVEVELIAQIWPIEEDAQPINVHWNIAEFGNSWQISI